MASLLNIMRYSISVRGFFRTPDASLIARKTGRKSDMFRLSVHLHELTPAIPPTFPDYFFAFLTSPLFSIELSILQGLGMTKKETCEFDHLRKVSIGQEATFGLWRHFDHETDPASTTTIMRAMTPQGIPFCDSWWSLEIVNETEYDLVFGTALIYGHNSWLAYVADPLHRLYSRLLLASAKEKLLRSIRGKGKEK